MTRIYLIVEGQTEEAFVRDILQPHYAHLGLYIENPFVVRTSSGHKGGVVSYAKVRPQIERFCKQGDAFVSTMFDLYGLPDDFPGKSDSAWPRNGSGHQKASFIETCMAQDIGRRNFIPNIMAHEFEALLFVQPEQFALCMDPPDMDAVEALKTVRETAAPEDINDAPDTAPSKRIQNAMPGYRKTVHGPLIALDIGLGAMRKDCPHFDAWLRKLEALPRV